MIFPQARYFKISKQLDLTEANISKSLDQFLFKNIEKTQQSTSGFVNPFSQYQKNPVYGMSGAYMVCLRTDSKTIPPSAVKRKTDKKVKEQEKVRGEKLNKADKDDIKEQVLSEMLAAFPLDFVKTKYVYGIIYIKEQLFVIDTASDADAELITTLLRRALGVFPVLDLESNSSPSVVMTSWLQDEDNIPDEVEVKQECQLVDAADEVGSAVHCKKQDLFAEEVAGHIDAGKEVSMIHVLWNDSLEFKLRSNLTISGIKLTDLLKEQLKQDAGEGGMAEKFDAEVAVVVDNMRMLAPYLLKIFS